MSIGRTPHGERAAGKRKAPRGGAGLIKSAPWNGVGGGTDETHINAMDTGAHYTFACGQIVAHYHANWSNRRSSIPNL